MRGNGTEHYKNGSIGGDEEHGVGVQGQKNCMMASSNVFALVYKLNVP